MACCENFTSNVSNIPTCAVTGLSAATAGAVFIGASGRAFVFISGDPCDANNWKSFAELLVGNLYTADDVQGSTTPTAPVAPVNPTVLPTAGDVIHEVYDDGFLIWTWTGTAWSLTSSYIYPSGETTAFDNTANIVLVTPATPLGASATAADGNFHIVNNATSQELWKRVGGVWVLQSVLSTSGNTTTIEDNTANNVLVTPASPLGAPATPKTGDVHIVDNKNNSERWAYNGATWVLQSVFDNGCCTTVFDNSANTVTITPATPLSPPATPGEGDLHVVTNANSQEIWKRVGGVWVLQSVLGTSGADTTVVDNTVNVVTTTPATPLTPPATPSDGDIHIVTNANSQEIWKRVAGAWVLQSVLSTSGITVTVEDNTSTNVLVTPATPLNPPATPSEGDIHVVDNQNNSERWRYDGAAWVLQSVFDNGCCTTVTDNTANIVTTTPATPLTPPATPGEGDLHIVNNANSQEIWKRVAGVWVLQSVLAASGKTTTFGNSEALELPTVPSATPNNPPASPVNGDTHIEQFDDGHEYWTYTGGVWVLTTTSHIFPTPVAAFEGLLSSLTVALDASASTSTQLGIGLTYAWTCAQATAIFNSTTAVAPTMTVPTAGTYEVTLTVTDENGQTNSVTQTFCVPRFEQCETVFDLPAAAFADTTNPTDAEVAAYMFANGQYNSGTILRFIGNGTTDSPEYIWEVVCTA